MALGGSNIMVTIGANIRDFEKKMAAVEKRAVKTGKSMQSIGKSMTIGITAPLALVGGLALKNAADLETMETAFVSMTGSAKNAKKVMKDLTDFTAKTPFQLEGVGQSAKQLLAFGVTQEDLLGRLKTLGDISAGANVPLNEMAAIFGKMKAKGKAMTEEILQMSDRGIPIIDVLAKQMGVAKSAIFDMASKSQISFKMVTKAMESMTKEGGIFANQMDKQSKTLAGIFSTLTDNVNLALGEIGETIVETFNLKEAMSALIVKIQSAVEWFKELSPTTKKVIVITTALVAAIGPLIAVIGTIITLAPLASAALLKLSAAFLFLGSPMGLAIIATGLLVAGFIALSGETKKARTEQELLAEASKKVADNTGLEEEKMRDLFEVAQDFNITAAERRKAIDEINTRYAEYLPNLLTEKSNVEEVAAAYDVLSIAMLKARRIEIAKELAKAQTELEKASKDVSTLGTGFQSARSEFTDFSKGLKTESNISKHQEEVENLKKVWGELTEEILNAGEAIKKTPAPSPGAPIGREQLAQLPSIEPRGMSVMPTNVTASAASLGATDLTVEKENTQATEDNTHKQQMMTRALDTVTKGLDVGGAVTQLAMGNAAGAAMEFASVVIGQSEGFQKLIKKLNKVLEPIIKVLAEFLDIIAAAIMPVLEALAPLLEAVASILGILFRAVGPVLNVFELLVPPLKILTAIVEATSKALETFLGWLGLAGGDEGKYEEMLETGRMLKAFNKGEISAGDFHKFTLGLGDDIESFATGGITNGPTLAMVGDNPSGKEYIIPSEKMGSLINGGSGGSNEIILRASGDDLVGVIRRNQFLNGRVNGI